MERYPMTKLEGKPKELSEVSLNKSRAAFEKAIQSKCHQVDARKKQSKDILFLRIKASLKNGDHESAAVLLDEMKNDLAIELHSKNESGIFSLPDFPLYIDQLST
jgi:hypothetical protein